MTDVFSFVVVFSVGQSLPLPAPSGGSSSSSWMEVGIDVLLESWSKPTETEGTSVNRPEARPPANAVAPGGEE